MASGGWSSLIEEMGINVAMSAVTVDVELDRCDGSVGSVFSLSDKERFSGGFTGSDAVDLEVNLADGISSSGPRARDGSTALRAGGLRASKSLNVASGIFLGISGEGDHLDGGRVGRPNTDVGVDSLDEDVIN